MIKFAIPNNLEFTSEELIQAIRTVVPAGTITVDSRGHVMIDADLDNTQKTTLKNVVKAKLKSIPDIDSV